MLHAALWHRWIEIVKQQSILQLRDCNQGSSSITINAVVERSDAELQAVLLSSPKVVSLVRLCVLPMQKHAESLFSIAEVAK